MFTPWIRRRSLKKGSKSRQLVMDGSTMSPILLLSLSAIFVGVGLFVIQRSMAEQNRPVPSVSYSPSPSASASMSPAPSSVPEGR